MISIKQLNEIDQVLEQKWYSLKTKKAKLKISDKSRRIDRIRWHRANKLLAVGDLIKLTDKVWYFTIFPTGGAGLINKHAICEILGVYSDKIVVGVDGHALEVPYIYAKSNNFSEETFEYTGRVKPKLKLIQGGK